MDQDVIDQLAGDWRSAGVRDGDMLLVHSSLGRTLRRIKALGVAPSPEIILQSFLRALGDSGTLLLPLFNFDFTKGTTFDMRHTPSQMGALTETGRLWPGAVRTGHPIYSFAVIGRQAGLFSGVRNYSGYGADSPFAILHREGGKIGVLDLPDQNSMTFYHYVEECLSVSYRYHKKFTAGYIDAAGRESQETFGLFVRDVERGVVTHVDPMGELLWEKHRYAGCRPGEGHGLRTIAATDMFNEVAAVIREGRGKGLLYEIE